MDERGNPPSAEDAAKARAIYANILRDANNNQTAQAQVIPNLAGKIFAAPQVDDEERTKTAELASLCNAHATSVEPINAGIDASMNPAVLTGLLNCNQQFLQQLAGFEAAAQDLESKGRPQLYQTLKAWMHDTQTTSALIQYLLHARPDTHPLATAAAIPSVAPRMTADPTPQPAPDPAQPSLPGIWDLALADGRRVEIAMDNSGFSYVFLDGSFAYWGTWSLYPQAGAPPLICLTRTGGYPVAYYGPLGSQAISYATNETWGITAFEQNKITFSNCCMIRRPQIALPLITTRISQVQAQFQAADARDKSNVANFVMQSNAITSVQNSMWDYINSGAGRP
jgi:hypothetical protein